MIVAGGGGRAGGGGCFILRAFCREPKLSLRASQAQVHAGLLSVAVLLP